MQHWFFRFLAACFALFLTPTLFAAQITTATVSGTILDIQGGVFNAFNTVVINARQGQVQYNSPTDLTIRNSETRADGSIDPTRLTPRTAGFGAATGAQAMRNLQLQFRFRF